MCLDGEVDHGDAPIPIPIIRPQLSLWSRDRDSLQAQGRAEVANVAKLQASSAHNTMASSTAAIGQQPQQINISDLDLPQLSDVRRQLEEVRGFLVFRET